MTRTQELEYHRYGELLARVRDVLERAPVALYHMFGTKTPPLRRATNISDRRNRRRMKKVHF